MGLRGIAIAIAASVFASTACAQYSVEPSAMQIIEKTRTTRATYSVFNWNVITPPGSDPVEEWSAEFHKGTLHRVETPRDRLVANCEEMTGTHLNVANGEIIERPEIARAACGVQANSRILSAEFVGQEDSRFGTIDRIELRDPQNVRTYAIAANGAIVGSTIELKDGAVLLDSKAVAMLDTTPQDIFTVESLSKSAVPKEFRAAPRTSRD
jgi:hypothetical protein